MKSFEDFHIDKKTIVIKNSIGIIINSTKNYMKVFANGKILEYHKVDWKLDTWIRIIPLSNRQDNETMIFKHYKLKIISNDLILDKYIYEDVH